MLRVTGIAMLVLILVLTACGGRDPDSPEGVVERFFDNLEDQDESGVKDVLCKDFQQNVNFDRGDGQEVKLKFDLDYDTQPADDDSPQVRDVEIHGRMQVIWETDHVRSEFKEKRDEAASWHVQVFKVDDEWRVCGGDPALLRFLDMRAVLDSFE